MSGDFDGATDDPSGQESDDTLIARDHDDTLVARDHDDTLIARDHDDTLVARDHDDTVNARAQLARRRSESAALPPREGVYIAPDVGPSDLSNLPGPFTPRQLARIDEALSLATEETGLLFSLYVGQLAEPTRPAAEKLAAQLPAAPTDGAVLVAVSPGQRVLHIITTEAAVKRLPNRVCALAALGMRAAFVGGDLTAGAVNGLRMLADAAGQQSSAHAPSPAPLA